jgi:tetratricopeptide (TPR) repeat protein
VHCRIHPRLRYRARSWRRTHGCCGLLGLGSEATSDEAERAIDSIMRDGRLQEDDALYLRDLLEMPQPEAAQKLYEAMDTAARTHGKERVVTTLVQHSADSRPLLLTIEDVHWADRETLSLLAAITRATAMSRTVLAMTTRLDGDSLDAHWRSMIGGGTLVTVDISPLLPADARSIARRFIDVTTFADQCIERAGGNPLFLEQLLRGAADLTDGRLPASIQSVVLARTDLLSTQDRRAARKRELHGAAAAIFRDDPVLRAEHLDRAGDPEAARAYLAAAKAQAILFRQDQAIALAARGLVLATKAQYTMELAMLVGDLQLNAGRGTEALEAYVQALAVAGEDADRCRALLGCASSNRLIARVDDAFSALAEAEPLAGSRIDDLALAEIHYLRGNLHFARGHLAECRSEHELALAAARRVESPEWQARALSGLADAQYMDCRMATALSHFAGCVNLCEANDLTRIAVPNRVMMGHCRIYTCEFDLGLDDMRVALDTAVRIGNGHAEMFATNSIGMCLTAAGRYLEADNVQAQALAQSRAIKARRYEAVILGHSAEVALSRGLRAEALILAREGREISEETGPGFVGPILYGLLALVEDKRTDQEAALVAGEALLNQGCVGHNYFWFRRYAIERALLLEDWNEVDRHADALLLRMANEPLAYASHVAERGHHLARRGRGDATDEAKLRLLSVAAAEMGLRIDALSSALRQI